MTTPISADWRIQFPYQVNSLTHVITHYCDVVASGDVTGFNVVDRLGSNTIGVSEAIDNWWVNADNIMQASATTIGAAILQQRVGLAWFPNAVYTPVTTLTETDPVILTSYTMLTMRDTLFHRIRGLMMETTGDVPSYTQSPTGFGANYDAYIAGFVTPTVVANMTPWLWVMGRSGLYIGSFVSATIALNRKLRRERGLA